ncbi:MAG TPA: HAMP domain-containing sensor histidine kinase [Polyangiaceae bacterium]|jgi:signal transduction histidine kinase|nr:HAMP domain-containing sensor histidine kinase [Polyangiaceae bacterium]
MTAAARPRDLRLVAYVALGGVAGALYVVFDLLSEARLRSGTLTGILADAHDVIDHTSPILVGGLLGVCAHYLRLRAQLFAAQEAAARAEALRTRLHKVERDQAVWVLAAAVLHELNNPLHALGLLLDELGASEGDPAQRVELVERARAQAGRALEHLHTLRAMRGLGEPELQRISLDRVIAAVAGDMGALAAEDGLLVRAECSRAVRASADPAYVRTIVENLLDNGLHSVRAAGRGGCVTVRVDSENGKAIVRVSDDGPPLDAAARDTLFEPLGSTKTQGLGLGLPIARALARAMRGDLVLEEVDRKAFRLELPGAP